MLCREANIPCNSITQSWACRSTPRSMPAWFHAIIAHRNRIVILPLAIANESLSYPLSTGTGSQVEQKVHHALQMPAVRGELPAASVRPASRDTLAVLDRAASIPTKLFQAMAATFAWV